MDPIENGSGDPIDEITSRYGLMPNFFRGSEPGVARELWACAKTAYLDNPLPAVFKERLFVHLSRFCPARYCIVRHTGFLIGQGHVAGDPGATPQTVEQAIALLRHPLPDAAALDEALARMEGRPASPDLPESGSEGEADLFAALAALFLSPREAQRARDAVRTSLGTTRGGHLTVFLAFVRSAHFWSDAHPNLTYDADMVEVLREHPDLARLLLDRSEAERVRTGDALRAALAERDAAQAETTRAQAALAASEDLFRLLATASFDATYRLSADWSDIRSLAGERLVGAAETPGNWLERYIPEADRAAVQIAIQEATLNRSALELEHRIIRANGTLGWTRSRAVPVLDAAGEISGWIGSSRDISERKRAEELRHLLINELNHRVKNTLATVQSIAAQTFGAARINGGLRHAFEARLSALSAAHDLLTRRDWSGVELHALLRHELTSYSANDERYDIAGPDVDLPPQTGLALGLAFHELAANAAKYGAFSREEGRVHVAVDVAENERRLRLVWREIGGPQIGAPNHRGFGSRLIEQGLAYELDGESRLDYRPEGLVCTIEIPLADLAEGG